MRDLKTLFSWDSFNRPTHVYTQRGLSVVTVIALVFTVFFVLFQEWGALFVTWAAYFLFVTLDRIPAERVSHKITSEGITSMEHSYIWQDLGPFWFKTLGENRLLYIARKNLFGQLVILIDKKDEEKIMDVLIKYLPYIEVPEKSLGDKLLKWVNKS